MLPLDYHKTILVISLQGMNGNFHGREVNQKAYKIAEPKNGYFWFWFSPIVGAKYFEVNPKKTNPKKSDLTKLCYFKNSFFISIAFPPFFPFIGRIFDAKPTRGIELITSSKRKTKAYGLRLVTKIVWIGE